MCATLDFILKSLIMSSSFTSLENKNWDAIARLVPGMSAMQCARRYEELLSGGGSVALQHLTNSLAGFMLPKSASGVSLAESESSGHSVSISRPSSSKSRGNRDEKGKSGSKIGQKNSDLEQNGPIMVIHVCDEAKNLTKDFHCPRDLLVQEMKYFAEYLSTDAQRWEEVDISVHCNVQIFDWLMMYVKRGTKDFPESPKLETNNVVSILISSDFLKMDSLVSECVSFCHTNMTSIVATPCNMGCINDRLLTKIADLFSHNEADDVKDRKDKFKSKLFCKKIEKLFQPDSTNPDSHQKATSLFRCSICKRHLTHSIKTKVKCVPSRMTFDFNGSVTYSHVPDPTFDVNEYILEVRGQVSSWRDVYWRLWGTINCLTCDRCGEGFPLTEFSHCCYHPEQPRYDNELSGTSSCTGSYPCCLQKSLRFDPMLINKGCQVKDHLVRLQTVGDGDKFLKTPEQQLYEDLLLRKDIICLPYQSPPDDSLMQADVFANEVFACHTHTFDLHLPSLSASEDEGKKMNKPRLQALTVEKEIFSYIDDFKDESDDEVGDEESQSTSGVSGGKKPNRTLKKSRVTVEPQAILVDAPGFEQTKKSTWDTQRSMRYNQDAQRQEDARRMKEIRLYLTKLRLTAEKVEKPKKEGHHEEVEYDHGQRWFTDLTQSIIYESLTAVSSGANACLQRKSSHHPQEMDNNSLSECTSKFAGGIYSKLESQWKSNNSLFQGKQLQQSQFRARPKPTGTLKPAFA